MSIIPQFSYWERETFLNDIDVAIIGGGIVGLNAALTIREVQPDWKICIIERGALPSGASTKNAGFACFGSVSEILEDIKVMGEEASFNLIERRWKGLQRLRERVGDSNMDFKCLGGYEVFKEDDTLMYQQCIEALPWLNERINSLLGLDNTYQSVDNKLVEFGFKGFNHMIWNMWEGQINPGKMMKTLMDKAQQTGIIFLNGLQVRNIFDSGADSVTLQIQDNGNIEVKKVLVATNGFARRLLPNLDVKPARNQVVVTHPIKGIPFEACFHYDRGYYYWRNIDGRILLGGGRNHFPHSEYTDDGNTTEEVLNMLEEFIYEKITPGKPADIDISWAGILGLGPIKAPIIEQVSPNVTVSVRMGGMGVALGSLAGEEGALKLIENC